MALTPPPLTAEMLLRAYAMGVFPMAEGREDPEVFWVDPTKRGIFPIGGFHVSRSLARRLRNSPYKITLNRDFKRVVEGCADREETWINDQIFDLYGQLHEMGHAHSFEVWNGAQLIGGVYGVSLGAAFFGESMFSRERDVSKMALAYLTLHLQNCEFQLFDTQFITPHLASLGAVEIPRSRYQEKLTEALRRDADITACPLPDAYSAVQRITQIS